MAAYPGLDVDEECALDLIVDSEVVSKRNNPKNLDIKLALLQFELQFGQERSKPFEIFNIFNDTKNLLFKVKIKHAYPKYCL